MKSIIPIVLASALASPAAANLSPGALAPQFETQAALAGKAFSYSLEKARKKGAVVLYFFPAAFTPGCTMEAHEFAEQVSAFKKLGATVIGAAGDDIEKMARFSKEECRNKFPVAVATPEMIKAYDVALPMMSRSNRTSYVIAPNGQIIFAYNSMDYRGHVSGALAAVKQWRESQKK